MRQNPAICLAAHNSTGVAANKTNAHPIQKLTKFEKK